MRAAISGAISAMLTSPTVRAAARASQALGRAGRKPHVRYFHDVGDPYSHLTAQLLARMIESYDAAFSVHLVSAPSAGAAPEPQKLGEYARRDAALLAGAHGLSFPKQAFAPDPQTVQAAQALLAGVEDAKAFAAKAIEIGDSLWSGASLPRGSAPDAVNEGDALRLKLGHYLGGTFHFEGEWYWGVDRLAFLEERLSFARKGAPVVKRLQESAAPNIDARGATLDFFLSFRSPYTYIAAERVRRLAERCNARLRLRFVLPMVMRGLPLPPAKRLYIVRDTKREAETLGIPFGRICDPVGKGTERGLAVLHHAIAEGRGEAFVESFLRGVFAEAVDAASDKGLMRLADRAGVLAQTVQAALADESWRAVAEANRNELFALGLWGVPSFKVEGCAPHWGQDRLWAVERDLRAVAQRAAPAMKEGAA